MISTLMSVLSPMTLALDRVALLLLALFLVAEYAPEWWRYWIKWHRQEKSSGPEPRRRSVKDIPGPWPAVPVMGTTWIFSSLGPYDLPQLHEAYKDMFARYGPIVKEESLWNYPIVSLMNRSDIEKVINSQSRTPLRPPTDVVVTYRNTRPDRYVSMGLVNEQGESWQVLRRYLTPGLTNGKIIQRFIPELNDVVDDLIVLLKERMDTSGKVVGFEDLAERIGLESSCILVLGRRMGLIEDTLDDMAKQLAEAVKGHFCASRDTFYGLPFWKILPSRAYSEFKRCEELCYDVISKLVDAALKEESDTCQQDAVRSIFMSILKTPEVDVRDKKAAIIDFIAAGIKTVGSTIVFLIHHLSKHPEVQKRLHEEIHSKVPHSGPITAADLREAYYLRACITESFRLLPTAMCLARILETDLELGGYHCKPGTVVLCHTWLASLEEANFTDAKQFRPERWLPEERKKLGLTNHHPQVLNPFGSGTRICPGKRFTELILEIFLYKIARDYHIEPAGELETCFEFILNPVGPVNFIFKDRN